MKKQLYTKNEKGRYEPYKEPVFDDNKLYRKLPNGKYMPVGMDVDSNMLTEGVWVVHKLRHCTGYTSFNYMRSCYKLDKVADLQNPLLQLDAAKLGMVNKIMENVFFDGLYSGRSNIDSFKVMCGEVIYQLTKQKV